VKVNAVGVVEMKSRGGRMTYEKTQPLRTQRCAVNTADESWGTSGDAGDANVLHMER